MEMNSFDRNAVHDEVLAALALTLKFDVAAFHGRGAAG